MWTQKLEMSITSYRGPLAIMILLLLAASSSGAQPTEPTDLIGTRVQTALMNVFTGGGRSIAVNVNDVGARGTETTVRIAFTDAAGRVISRAEGQLTPGQPVTHELLLDTSQPRMLVGATITFVGERGRRSLPIIAVEDINPLGLTITPRILCSPPAAIGGPVLPNCDGGIVSNFVVAN